MLAPRTAIPPPSICQQTINKPIKTFAYNMLPTLSDELVGTTRTCCPSET